jgi:hypothetical protein
MDEQPTCLRTTYFDQKENLVMLLTKLHRAFVFAFLCVAVSVGSAQMANAQTSDQAARPSASRDEDTNLDTQLYLVFATNREVEDIKLPLALEPAMKRLRETLNFKHYNLAASFLNRVKNGGHLDVTWVGGPLLASANSATGNPSFNQFAVQVRLWPGEGGQQLVRLTDLRFGSRVPIVTAQSSITSASTNAASFPVINYEPIGLRTDISMREGEPVVAGTLNVGPSGDAIVVVIAARRAAN